MRVARYFCIIAACAMFLSCRKDNVIHIPVPERPAGQTDVIGLTAEPIDTVRIGFIGQGMRGRSAIKRFIHMDGIRIAALCDLDSAKVMKSRARVVAVGMPEPDCYWGDENSWKTVCEKPDIDLIYCCTDWKSHAEIGIYAMEHGKHVALEVPASMSLDESWALINASEKTRKHCIQIENCCYDFFELSSLAMAQAGVFGEIIHAEGSYFHNLDPFWDEYAGGWRLEYNYHHRGDLYPTHGLGPVCQALDIHRGDRMTMLVAMDTGVYNGIKHARKRGYSEPEKFANADQTSTMIKTAKGKTILIEHDVMTPRPYDRMYQLVGTDGYAGKYPIEQYCLRGNAELGDEYDKLDIEKVYEGEELQELQKKYPSPILTESLIESAKKVGGHGGMDFIMDYRLIYCLRSGLPLDMDVYDLAEWCCLNELTRISLENGCAPVEIPDFTRGSWDKVDGFSFAL